MASVGCDLPLGRLAGVVLDDSLPSGRTFEEAAVFGGGVNDAFVSCWHPSCGERAILTRNFASIFAACVVSQISIDLITVAWDHSVNGRSDYFHQLLSVNHIAVSMITLMLHPVAYLTFDRALMSLAGRFFHSYRLKAALAYAIFLLMVSVLFVWPLNNFTANVNLTISVIGFLSGFAGGYFRGWLIDHWTGGARMGALTG
jgi:hypothetical protein